MFCWHKWSKWKEYEVTQESLVNPRHPMEYRVNVKDIILIRKIKYQQRQCERCGKLQRERI